MRTTALVIGNNDYFKGAELDNAVNDANSIAEIFERLGYNVLKKLNFKVNEIPEILKEFEDQIIDYDASIFYFAGHGFEIKGENFLASVECQVSQPEFHQCKHDCIRLNEVLEIFKLYPNKINIAIIDACRRSFDRSGIVGFSPIQAPKGTLIAFSTSPNDGASDKGFEGNSIYTGTLLKYIGRERLSVEELFKKVRKSVHALTNGKQTTWEHTSLIGDYYFNTGQLVLSINIPYSEIVVKDIQYNNSDDEFGRLIHALKTHDWNIQNPALSKLLGLVPKNLDKNQLFILGRNILQSSGAAFNAQYFMDSLAENLEHYTINGENHLLNGILFEIYYDNNGEFRRDKTKKHYFEEIIELRKNPKFEHSFSFIINLLKQENYPFIYFPTSSDNIIDVEIQALKSKMNYLFKEREIQIINSITYNGNDIAKEIAKLQVSGFNQEKLKEVIANFLSAPIKLVNLISKFEITFAFFESNEDI